MKLDEFRVLSRTSSRSATWCSGVLATTASTCWGGSCRSPARGTDLPGARGSTPTASFLLAQHRDVTAERSAPTSSSHGRHDWDLRVDERPNLGEPDLVRVHTAEPNGGELGQVAAPSAFDRLPLSHRGQARRLAAPARVRMRSRLGGRGLGVPQGVSAGWGRTDLGLRRGSLLFAASAAACVVCATAWHVGTRPQPRSSPRGVGGRYRPGCLGG
jgi:hypothetical protein